MTTGFVWHERYMWHETTGHGGFGFAAGPWMQPGTPIEGPEPKRRIRNLLDAAGVLDRLVPIAPRHATIEEITRVHDEAYVLRIRRESGEQGGLAGPSTAFGPGSFEIAQLAAGGVMAAADAVLDGAVDNAYALVRPPGHHAMADVGIGLCIFGNVAVTAQHLRHARGLERVAVVDWDVHHGNGTQFAFYDDPSVLTISLHQANMKIGPTIGAVEERGEGAGEGANLNIPLPPGSGRGAYMAAMERVVVPALRAFRPELILIASGLDANAFDPSARMMLFSDAFRDMTRAVMDAADELCDGRVVAAHEGGYSEHYSAFCGAAIVETLAGIRSPIEDPLMSMSLRTEVDQLLQPHQADAVDAAAAVLTSA